MELFSIVIVNLMFCGIMYVMVSVKVQKAVEEYYDHKLNKSIDQATIEIIKELDTTQIIVESKMIAIQNLLEKTMEIKKEIEHYANQVKLQNLGANESRDFTPMDPIPKKEIPTQSPPTKELKEEALNLGAKPLSNANKLYEANQALSELELTKTTEGAATLLFGSIGKAVKGVLGVNESIQIEKDIEPEAVITYKPKMDYTISGNPFENQRSSTRQERDSKSEFLTQLSYANDPSLEQYQKQKDRIELSVESALQELPPSASKIDKVVHLIRKGFSKPEIADSLNIAVQEIRLIETIRLDRTRMNS